MKAHFAKMGVEEGSTVLVHSSFKALGGVEGGPRTVVQALRDLAGPEGTVVLPTFNFDSWTERHYFDIVETRSEMGAITEVARHDPAFLRTRHPINSFVIAGRRQRELTGIDSTHSYGAGSVFDALHRSNALMLSLGLDFNSTFSMTHHVEKISGVCGYRYDKSFSGIYVGYDRVPALRTYDMMVRDVFRGVETYIVPAMTELVRQGAIVEYEIQGATCHASRAKDFVDHLLPIVRDHPEKLHRIGKPR
jgi:aminoglycoside N3'-acetyltransferase